MKTNTLSILTGVCGMTLLILSIPLTRAGLEPFVTWYYVIAWGGLILFLDSINTVCGDSSMIFSRPLGFLSLLFWSAVIWFLFELINFRVSNWYYVFASDSYAIRLIGSWLSFATVLPAIFLVERTLYHLNLFKSPSIPCFFRLTERGVSWAFASGLVFLCLALAFPTYAFPLVWVFGFLLPLPLVKKRTDCLLLKELQAGQSGQLLRWLAAGLVCGLIWEFLNSFARIRWIYTVPFLEDLKFFEMPPLGFLGFPPFALECVMIYALLVGFGVAPSVKGVVSKRPGNKTIGPLAHVLGLILGFFTLNGMETFTIDSYTPRPSDFKPSQKISIHLEQPGVRDCFELKKSLCDPVYRAGFPGDRENINKALDLVKLSLLRGMGVKNAQALYDINIQSIKELAVQDPDQLADALKPCWPDFSFRKRRARINVWVKAAVEAVK